MEEPDPEFRTALLDLVGKGLESGGRVFEGLFSTPWTGVPTALLIISQIDPSGKLTAKFLANLGTFLTALGTMLVDAINAAVDHFNDIVPPPLLTFGSGPWCVKVQIQPVLRFVSVGALIVPAGEYCFMNEQARDLAIAEIKQKLGPLVAFYTFIIENKPGAVSQSTQYRITGIVEGTRIAIAFYDTQAAACKDIVGYPTGATGLRVEDPSGNVVQCP